MRAAINKTIKGNYEIWKKYPRVMTFGVIFCFFLLMHFIFNIREYPYDANQYWTFGKEMWISKDVWKISGLSTGFRGFVFPAYLSLCAGLGERLGNEQILFWLTSSAIFAFFFSYLLNELADMLKLREHGKNQVLFPVFCAFLSFLFFRGLFLYPLSDIYALVCCMTAIVLSKKMFEQNGILQLVTAFVVGVMLYSAYNIRTIYQFPALVSLGVGIVLVLRCKETWFRKCLLGGTTIVGGLLCAIPQYFMNRRMFGTRSITVPTENLMIKQLFYGILCDRYDTFIGNVAELDTPKMVYADAIGRKIVQLEAGGDAFVSFGEFFTVLWKHPFDAIGIYVRHMANMLYPIFPNQYVESLKGNKMIYLLLFYTLLFMAVISSYGKFRKDVWKYVTLVILLVPCIFILPGAVEIRFFFVLHLLIYMYAVYGWKDALKKVKTNVVRYIVYYGVGLGIYIAIAGYMLTSLEGAAVLL